MESFPGGMKNMQTCEVFNEDREKGQDQLEGQCKN